MKWTLLLAVLCVGCSSPSPLSPSTSTVVSTPAPAPVVLPPVAPLPTRGPQFDQTFWNEFVYNGLESPSALQPLHRLTTAPMLYLKTVDEAGIAIDPVTLSTVENAMRSVAQTWSGGSFGLAGVQRGTDTMAGAHGWLTVRWLATNIGTVCGRSNVGLDGGVIELNYQNHGCACPGGINLSPRVAKHELGHAFGYWHTDHEDDVMRAVVDTCDANPSAREVYHATVAYGSPIDSTGVLATSGASLMVVD